MEHTWIEINRQALTHNVQLFRKHIGEQKKLLVPVKANAYGHGIAETVPLFAEAGVDWFGVHSLQEAIQVQHTGVEKPILILGYVPIDHLDQVVERGFRLVISSWETFDALAKVAATQRKVVPVHIKVETGTNRQGVCGRDLQILARFVEDSPSSWMK